MLWYQFFRRNKEERKKKMMRSIEIGFGRRSRNFRNKLPLLQRRKRKQRTERQRVQGSTSLWSRKWMKGTKLIMKRRGTLS